QAHLAQISQLLGPSAASLASAAAAPALAGPRAAVAAPPAANGGGGQPARSGSAQATATKTEAKPDAGKQGESDEEWWTE
ncbi:MAG: hypothetical protein ACTHKL_02520, partial [Streptosporangiaceae bacterium]